jgi:phosphoglycerol transferase MdoB-like AlkP superfamily enzyme
MEKIYSFLSGLYGDELHDFLLGINGMNDTNLFNVMFVVLFIISACLVPGFYYKIWDRATWASLGKWMLMLAINALIVFIVNVIWVHCLGDMMVNEDDEKLLISATNIIGFGFASAIIGSILFFVASLFWKIKSTNCPYTPF